MLTPGYAITATERVLPRLFLDFTTAVTDARVTTARAGNTATRINASGVIEVVNANLPRYDFDPVSLVCKGQLIEEVRDNLFLNSLIDGTNLSTQTVSLSAVAYVLSFYGTGSVVISGGHSATVAGTGNFPSRVTYAFTPTAGNSTFTVSGDVKFAQLEAGAFATSFIPTAGTSVRRNSDIVSMTGTNFSSWFNATQGSFVAAATPYAIGSYAVYSASNGGFNNRIQAPAADSTQYLVGDGGVIQAFLDAGTLTAGVQFKTATSYKAGLFALSLNGGAVVSIASGTVPSVNRFDIGNLAGFAEIFNGWIPNIRYYPQSLTFAELRAFSK
jgi:hypothetical protein